MQNRNLPIFAIARRLEEELIEKAFDRTRTSIWRLCIEAFPRPVSNSVRLAFEHRARSLFIESRLFSNGIHIFKHSSPFSIYSEPLVHQCAHCYLCYVFLNWLAYSLPLTHPFSLSLSHSKFRRIFSFILTLSRDKAKALIWFIIILCSCLEIARNFH